MECTHGHEHYLQDDEQILKHRLLHGPWSTKVLQHDIPIHNRSQSVKNSEGFKNKIYNCYDQSNVETIRSINSTTIYIYSQYNISRDPHENISQLNQNVDM